MRPRSPHALACHERVAWLYGFELALDKVECGPHLDYVGTTFDCRAQELSIHPEKQCKAPSTAPRLLALARGMAPQGRAELRLSTSCISVAFSAFYTPSQLAQSGSCTPRPPMRRPTIPTWPCSCS